MRELVSGTALDRMSRAAGLYAASPWPAECGGARRQKAADGGLIFSDGRKLHAIHRDTGQWNVMMIRRDRGELFLQGNTPPGHADPHGWVERIDPLTLETLDRSPRLPAGGHTWCGAALVHATGDLIVVNGAYVHRLDPALQVRAERRLGPDRPHNGALALHDGAVLTKDLRLDAPSTLSVLDPHDLSDAAAPLVLPEPSLGRIAADFRGGADHVIVPGTEHLFRVVWDGHQLRLDMSWRPRYRTDGDDSGLAWDTCLSAGSVWLHDDGDITSVREIHRSHPAGAGPLQELPTACWDGPLRLLRVAIDDPTEMVALAPFGVPAGWVIAPPAHVAEHDLTVCFDTGNRRLGAVRDGRLLWQADVACWMQPLAFPDTGQLVVDDFTGTSDDLVVLDLTTGAELGRVATGSRIPNGMFLTPGEHDDVLYCSNPTIARIWTA